MYEANADLTEFGAGITLYARTRYILRELGLEEALKAKALSPMMCCRKSDTRNGHTFQTFGENGELMVPYLGRQCAEN